VVPLCEVALAHCCFRIVGMMTIMGCEALGSHTYIMNALFFTASGLSMAHFAVEVTKNTTPVQ